MLGDLHAGVRTGNLIVAKHQLDFFEFELFPYMLKHDIKIIIQMGDMFDSRKFTSHTVLHEWHQRFFQMCRFHGFELHALLGNHDLALRNSLSINSPTLFLCHYDNITIYDEPAIFKHNDFEMLMVPWICSENYEKTLDTLVETTCPWVAGHFEIQNFEMHKGQVNTEGFDSDMFNKFDTVLSGHFHTRSRNHHICYVGTPYEMTWVDHGDPKGFHVLNTKTLDLEFVENSLKLFKKMYYNDKDKGMDYHKSFDLTDLKGKYVKVIVVNKSDPYEFDRLMDKLSQLPMLELKVVEDMSELDADQIDDDDIKLTDTPSLIESFIEASETELDKTRLKTFMKTLYIEALDTIQ